MHLPKSPLELLQKAIYLFQKTSYCPCGTFLFRTKPIFKLAAMNIEVVSVPANMTHFFQPLDLTVNREAKKFMKDQFTAWYSAQIHTQLDSGVPLDDVDVDMRLSVLKPIHATWLVSMFNHLSSSEGRISIAKGWKKAGISEVIDGKELPPEDPFEDL